MCMTPLQFSVVLCKRRVLETVLPCCLHCMADRYSDRKRRCVFVQVCDEVSSVVVIVVLCAS